MLPLSELDLLICGIPTIAVKNLIKNTVYIDLYDANHFVILLKIFAISKFPLLSDTINGVFFSLCFFVMYLLYSKFLLQFD